MRRLSLNWALMIAVIAALAPIAAISVAQGLSVRDYARDLISQRLVASALATASVQREPIRAAEDLLEELANDPVVRGPGAGCDALLARRLEGQKSILNLSRAYASGEVVCSALPFVRPMSMRSATWYEDRGSPRGFHLSAPVVGRVTKRNVLVALLPLFDRAGKLDGAITASIDADWLKDSLERPRFSPDAVVAITDGAGKPLLQTDGDKLPNVDLMSSRTTSATIDSATGADWQYASAPLYEGQLHIVYAEREQSLLTPIRDQIKVSIALPILALLLTCVALYAAINRFVVRWLLSLGKMAREIAGGNYAGSGARFDDAPAEIAALGDDLDDMAGAIAERDSALRQSADSNRAMAREINHRVKNNLQMVMSLIGLQSSRLEDPEARRALEQTRIRMGAIALVHRLLYEQGDASDRGEVDMDRLIADLCAQMRSSIGRDGVQIECASDSGVVPVDTAVPIMLFAVEAVSNAFRHAFPEDRSGEIELSLTGSTTGTLIVTDNGVGYARSKELDKMGIELMEAYTSQLGGTLSVDHQPGGGTRVALSYGVSDAA